MEVRELSPIFGSEITDIDPEAAVGDADTRRELQRVFDERGLVVFPGLDLDTLTQHNLARALIDLPVLDELPEGRQGKSPMYVSNKEKGGGAPYGRLLFHCDTMWSSDPIKVLSLYGVEVEQPATPTQFASAKYAWDTLSDDLKERVQGLHAVHGHDDAYPEREMDDPDVLRSSFESAKMTTTPVAWTHPRTGDTLLYVSQQITMEIVELPADESEALLQELFAHLYRPEVLFEHPWKTGDLVAWDNQAVQHARPNLALDGPTRTLRKVFAPPPEQIAVTAHPKFANARM
jgi:alpha-ketoglutarate-dependent taurine dioxygenase